ncbi:MAG TPA: helix-turn-helix domain-containing protein [Alphaproteobacteria bacterium]|nr:helix-turn-helix domain-containing protein [Alphaproteobacteria bacterium]
MSAGRARGAVAAIHDDHTTGAASAREWANRLIWFRRFRGLKQLALAQLLEVDQATVSRWERGQSVPHLRGRQRLRDLLRATTGDDALLKHAIAAAIGEVVLSSSEDVVIAASRAYAAANGITADEIAGKSLRPTFIGDSRHAWQAIHGHGFFNGDVASATVFLRVLRLCGGPEWRCVKAVCVPVRLSNGCLAVRGEWAGLTEGEFAAGCRQNGGPLRLVMAHDLGGGP